MNVPFVFLSSFIFLVVPCTLQYFSWFALGPRCSDVKFPRSSFGCAHKIAIKYLSQIAVSAKKMSCQ